MKLGDRIKRYEKVTHFTATRRMPLMIRVDGRAFHTFTKNMRRPFDSNFMSAMVAAASSTANEMQGFKAAYVQSDEATFCITDYDRIESQGWFDYDLSKIISISAATMSVRFKEHLACHDFPVFDGRAFSVPQCDVINAFLWRAKDWERNSLQMYARAFFSHKELHSKGRKDMHDMLHGIRRNWATDLNETEKNGTFILNGKDGLEYHHPIPTYESLSALFGDIFSYDATEMRQATNG